jgi:hypothetical protein
VLDVFSQGMTKEEAKRNLEDALKLFLISCHERGTLDSVLKECGFSLTTDTSSLVEEDEDSFVKVPLYFDAPDRNPAQCQA